MSGTLVPYNHPAFADINQRDRVIPPLAAALKRRYEQLSDRDAESMAEYEWRIAQIQADDGASDIPWLDARRRSTPARPWSSDDWEVDKRRAAAHGLNLSKGVWEATTEQGQDPVADAFDERKKAQLLVLIGNRNGIASRHNIPSRYLEKE